MQFYRSIIESILTFSLTTWFGSTTQQNRDDLQRVVRSASKIIGCDVPPLQLLYDERLVRKAKSILRDESHPAHSIFQPLPSGKRFRTLYARTERSRNTFFHRAVKALSTKPWIHCDNWIYMCNSNLLPMDSVSLPEFLWYLSAMK